MPSQCRITVCSVLPVHSHPTAQASEGESALTALRPLTKSWSTTSGNGGSTARRYCWVGESGEIRFDEGAPISAKGNLLRAADLDGDWGVFDLADEDTVMAVAAE